MLAFSFGEFRTLDPTKGTLYERNRLDGIHRQGSFKRSTVWAVRSLVLPGLTKYCMMV